MNRADCFNQLSLNVVKGVSLSFYVSLQSRFETFHCYLVLYYRMKDEICPACLCMLVLGLVWCCQARQRLQSNVK